MVKYLNLALDDSDFEDLLKLKGDLTWSEFVKKLIEYHSGEEHA